MTKQVQEIEYDKFTDTLPCALKGEEVEERAMQLARLQEEIDAKTAQMKADQAHRKAAIQELEGRRSSLCAEIRDRKEYRRVDCEEIRNYRLGTVQKLRLDTNEVFDVRPMNYDERQRVLPMLEQAAKDELDHAGKAIVDANKVGTIKVEAQETVEVVEAEPKRGRGRPKGSKNAPKQADAPKPAKGARKLRKGVKSTGEAMEQLS